MPLEGSTLDATECKSGRAKDVLFGIDTFPAVPLNSHSAPPRYHCEHARRVVGTSGRISLGKKYAGKTLRLLRRDDGSILITEAMVAESQLWTLEEPHRSRIARGLAWAAETVPQETDIDHLVPSDDPLVTEEDWLFAARQHFSGKIVLAKDLLEI